MARVTPPMYAKGLFQLRDPFAATPTVQYTVSAIRTFEEIRAKGDDPLALVYLPRQLTAVEYQADVAAGAAVITLLSATEKPLYVPDTYILSYPNMGAVPYSWLVASASLGMLPDSYDTNLLAEKIKGVISDFIGVESTVNIGRAPTTSAVTDDEHVQLTAARQAAIKNRSTDYASVAQLQQVVASQTERIQQLEALILRYQDGSLTP